MLGAVSHCDGAVAEADLLALFRHMLIANRFWLLSAAGLPFVYEQESEPQASLDEVVSGFAPLTSRSATGSRRRLTLI